MKRVFAAAIFAAVITAPAASAKDGAQAHLLTPPPAHARPGALITLRWTVTEPAAKGRRVPFGATGMFATLVGATGNSTTATASQTRGRYSVRIRVPAGGIHAIKLGLHGFVSDASGTRPAPVFFPLR